MPTLILFPFRLKKRKGRRPRTTAVGSFCQIAMRAATASLDIERIPKALRESCNARAAPLD
jgi:hypothetical protein